MAREIADRAHPRPGDLRRVEPRREICEALTAKTLLHDGVAVVAPRVARLVGGVVGILLEPGPVEHAVAQALELAVVLDRDQHWHLVGRLVDAVRRDERMR